MTSALENLRISYKPDIVRVLFIGESPPANGTFFYLGNSNLAKYTQQAFRNVFGEAVGDGKDFLRFFKEHGCYLDDLCLKPVNHMDNPERQRARGQGVRKLSECIQVADPKIIIAVMKGILPFVEQAAFQVKPGPLQVLSVPFPANGNQRRYVEELTDILQSLQGEGILP